MKRLKSPHSREAAVQSRLLRLAHRDLGHAVRLVRRLDRLAGRMRTESFRLIVDDLRVALLEEIDRSLWAS